MFDDCPFCHRPFAAEQVSKEQVDSNMILEQNITVPESASFLGLLLPPNLEIDAVARHPEAFLTYKMTYRCKHCGKEWSRTTVKERDIPIEYAEDEDERTDADAERETEAAREEEYARDEE